MPWLRDRLVSDRKSGCYGEVGCHGTHGYRNCRHGMSHMENHVEGLTEKHIRSVIGQFMIVTMHACMAEK